MRLEGLTQSSRAFDPKCGGLRTMGLLKSEMPSMFKKLGSSATRLFGPFLAVNGWDWWLLNVRVGDRLLRR